MIAGFNKWVFIFFISAGIYIDGKSDGNTLVYKTAMPGKIKTHPLHVSVTEINHNAADKTLEISCKLFADDFEKVLSQLYKTKVDLINPTDRAAAEKLVNDFIQKHLSIKAGGKLSPLLYIGYKKDDDAIYSYFEVDDIGPVKKWEITNTILHEMFTDEINLIYFMVGGKRKTVRLDYPEKTAIFTY